MVAASESNSDSSMTKFKWLAIIAAIISSGVIGQGLYSWNSEKSNMELAVKAYQFEKEYLSKFKEKKMEQSEILNEFNSLMKDGSGPALVLSGINLADNLMELGEVGEAKSLLSKLKEKKSTVLGKYFLLTRLSVAQEDMKDYKGAIASLEEALKLQTVVLSDKLYFDLGRLYFKSGNTEKAKMSFDYVLDKGKDSDLLKLTRIYLTKLSTKNIN